MFTTAIPYLGEGLNSSIAKYNDLPRKCAGGGYCIICLLHSLHPSPHLARTSPDYNRAIAGRNRVMGIGISGRPVYAKLR
jgi:hypothetical protein